MKRWAARIYLNNFLKSLKAKIVVKHLLITNKISIAGLRKIKTFHDFDGTYTGPMHGFKDEQDYYGRSSSINFLSQINIPTLMVNALNDPFLPKECYPKNMAENNTYLFLEMPETGGHVGFVNNHINGVYWSERRAVDFLENDQ